MTPIEARLEAAFDAARRTVEPNPDLFARVTRSLDEQRRRVAWRWRVARWAAGYAAVLLAVTAVLGKVDNGRFTMSWWLIELLTNIVLVTIAVVLGPFIKRFGRSYAADVFRATPRTGKSYLVLTDVAYYLIFSAFILFTISVEDIWLDRRPEQWKHELARVGGILLIMGLLHAANVVALPVMGRMLSGKGLDARSSSSTAGAGARDAGPPLGPGTWIVRVEQAPAESAPTAPPRPE